MQLRAPIAIQAVLKSFADVVLPAIAPDNTLAQEQARLIIGLLTLVARRLPLEYDYDLDELRRATMLARALNELVPDAAFDRQRRHCEDVLKRAGASPIELQHAIRELRASLGDRIHAVAALDAVAARESARCVLDAAREQQLRERAWLAPQGWESDPAALPPIESLLEAR